MGFHGLTWNTKGFPSVGSSCFINGEVPSREQPHQKHVIAARPSSYGHYEQLHLLIKERTRYVLAQARIHSSRLNH